MSNRELAKSLIDRIPEGKLLYVVAYLEGVTVPNEMPDDEIPNDETLAAFAELDNGGGHRFSGTTEQLFAELLED